ncbi:MAG: phosphate ABC transporter permease subunit PstC [Fusobacterium varium]|uniref:phosphate ABC transporter permease subunit PstC n=1 Tax=Fusobacterium TaxID=848 RepID=UPI0008A5B018|nr:MULTISPECIES: phosphate ABC transporter permease subunit PstC [Fusobacterium]MCF2672031.1 phosphate ABC transporter permease subunit PstC [Fusobacterium varium]OFL78467.1 phosphate ABC transporter permease subunit PstC [Fusobacterium sp. HMSC073F01]
MLFWKKYDKVFAEILKIAALISFLMISFIIIFILKESLPLFREVGLKEFILGKRWKPVSVNGQYLGILPIISATFYVSFTAVLIALPVGVGCSIFLSCVLSLKIRNILKPYVDILAGVPSVIYGFMGLVILVKFFESMGMATGETVLAGGILLSIMILPFMISLCEENMRETRERYEKISEAMGVSKWYMVSEMVLPLSTKTIIISIILSMGRAMGETMAVMMVIGNAPIFPKLLGKAQTISSLIALEMGMTEVGSLHYSALFASGFILMMMIFCINILINYLKKRFL